MCEIVISVLMVVIVPVIVGYFYGKNQIDPDTEKGRIYYDE
jgi:hypothetical protein